jgi:MoxR-like ATPase
MSYKRIYDPAANEDIDPAVSPGGDRRSGYVYTDELILAINVALATSRPLLVQGPPGCGKSSLALDIARTLDRSYYPEVTTSRTQARDLLWQFDAVRRLGDAHTERRTGRFEQYIEPRALWWAFDPELAARRGVRDGELGFAEAKDPAQHPGKSGAVVLLDEIDKADADVPNDLLVTLGTLEFRVDEIGLTVRAKSAPFMVITSNDERELPAAFVRRCVPIRLTVPSQSELAKIARVHYPLHQRSTEWERLIEEVTKRFLELTKRAEELHLRAPGTAEFLDAIRACVELQVDKDSPVWRAITSRALWKHTMEKGQALP